MIAAAQHQVSPIDARIAEKQTAFPWSSVPELADITRNKNILIDRSECPPIDVKEGQSSFEVILPVEHINPRNIYIFARPHSLLIEIRSKLNIRHPLSSTFAEESIHKQILREISFPVEIDNGATSIQLCGMALRISLKKLQLGEQASCSKLVPFDTLS